MRSLFPRSYPASATLLLRYEMTFWHFWHDLPSVTNTAQLGDLWSKLAQILILLIVFKISNNSSLLSYTLVILLGRSQRFISSPFMLMDVMRHWDRSIFTCLWPRWPWLISTIWVCWQISSALCNGDTRFRCSENHAAVTGCCSIVGSLPIPE